MENPQAGDSVYRPYTPSGGTHIRVPNIIFLATHLPLVHTPAVLRREEREEKVLSDNLSVPATTMRTRPRRIYLPSNMVDPLTATTVGPNLRPNPNVTRRITFTSRSITKPTRRLGPSDPVCRHNAVITAESRHTQTNSPSPLHPRFVLFRPSTASRFRPYTNRMRIPDTTPTQHTATPSQDLDRNRRRRGWTLKNRKMVRDKTAVSLI